MPMNLENLINHIINTRNIKKLSQEDCAHMLGISTQEYSNFEQGEGFLSLPEIELLSTYLGISLRNLLSEKIISDSSQINMLQDSLRPHYMTLRHKMISAKMAHESSIKAISLDELKQAIGIPLEKLTAYLQGSTPIPINDLIAIADALSLPLEGFINQKDSTQIILETEKNQQDWHPELNQTEVAEDHEKEYQILIDAIKEMPIDEQANMAKFVLSVLKNQ